MSLSCEVIRDLLPLYHDGVCSGESRELVEAHLCGCADCAAVLRELRGEIELPHEEPDDGAVLKKLRKNMKRTWLRGAAAVLTAVLLVAAGWYGWWYVNDYCYYQQFAQGHEPMDSEAGSHSYSWTVDGYDFRVDVPRYPGDECGVQVTTALRDMPRNIVPGREVELSLFLGREDYCYYLPLTITVRTAVPGQAHLRSEVIEEFLALDKDLNPIPAGVFDQATHDRQAEVLETYHTEILDIIRAAQAEWPFLAE